MNEPLNKATELIKEFNNLLGSDYKTTDDLFKKPDKELHERFIYLAKIENDLKQAKILVETQLSHFSDVMMLKKIMKEYNYHTSPSKQNVEEVE